MRDQGRHLRAMCGGADHDRQSPAEQPIAALLVAWQATGARAVLEQLLKATRPRLERWITAVLRQHGVHDENAVDDAMSLVLDHVRRLAGAASGDRPVAAFEPARTDRRDRIELLIDGESQAMIAAALKLSEGTVSRLRARAVAQLRERLASIR